MDEQDILGVTQARVVRGNYAAHSRIPAPPKSQESPSSTFFTNPLALPAGVWYKQ